MDPQSNKKENSEPEFKYNFYSLNNKPDSIVMLKEIKDVLPLFVVTPIFLLFKCPDQINKKLSDKSFKFKEFDEIGVMERHIQSKLVREQI